MPPPDEGILERLIRMEEKLDHYLLRANSQSEDIKNLDSRLRVIETGTARIMGQVAMFSLGVSMAASLLAEKLIGSL